MMSMVSLKKVALVALIFALMQSGMVVQAWPLDGDFRGDLLRGRLDTGFLVGGLIHGVLFYYVVAWVQAKFA